VGLFCGKHLLTLVDRVMTSAKIPDLTLRFLKSGFGKSGTLFVFRQIYLSGSKVIVFLKLKLGNFQQLGLS